MTAEDGTTYTGTAEEMRAQMAAVPSKSYANRDFDDYPTSEFLKPQPERPDPYRETECIAGCGALLWVAGDVDAICRRCEGFDPSWNEL